MPGSSQSIAEPVTILNTIMAEELGHFADMLEQAENFNDCLHQLIKDAFKEHKRIVFSGNGYENAWVEEAERRGLANLSNTASALNAYLLEKNVSLMTKHGVYSAEEIRARHDVHIEKYCKVIRIEAATIVDMVQHGIINAVSEYEAKLCDTALLKQKALPCATTQVELSLAGTIGLLNEELLNKTVELKTALETVSPSAGNHVLLEYYHLEVEKRTEEVRKVIDKLETLTASKYWPYPTFYEILFSV